MTKRHTYTDEQVAFIREAFREHPAKTVIVLFAERFDVELTLSQIESTIARYKIHQYCRRGAQKGHTPHNKGKRHCYPGMERGWFKPGSLPPCHLPIGSERMRGKGAGYQYLFVKVSEPDVWRPKHHIIWEQANGREVPEGHRVLFGNGNPGDFSPENLLLVSVAQLGMMVGKKYFYGDAALTKVGITLAQLTITKNKRTKNKPKEVVSA